MHPMLPRGDELSRLLGLPEGIPATALDAYLERALHGPLSEFLSRPGKALRGQLVEAGHELAVSGQAGSNPAACRGLSACVEAIHAGSLIVDDIEDGSRVRRGMPTLHLQHGLPVALNAGNWLYFLAIRRCFELKLEPGIERTCLSLLSEALLRAHYGQALDVGVPIDEVEQEKVHDLCIASMQLKSGALMALALMLGAASAGAGDAHLGALRELGDSLGVALQMFDDVRNLEGSDPSDPANLKRLEDLYQRRASWIWACAARKCEARDYQDFVRAVRMLPDESFLKAWLGIHGFQALARVEAQAYLDRTFERFERSLGGRGDERHARALGRLREIAEAIAGRRGS